MTARERPASSRRPLLRSLALTAQTVREHVTDDPVLLALQVSRRLPPAAAGGVAKADSSAAASSVGPSSRTRVRRRNSQAIRPVARTSATTSSRRISRESLVARSLISSRPSASPRPITSMLGTPSSSKSPKRTPGETFFRSSNSTLTPASSSWATICSAASAAWAIRSNRAPGISAAVSRTRSGGVAPSWPPAISWTGRVSRAASARRSASAMAWQQAM